MKQKKQQKTPAERLREKLISVEYVEDLSNLPHKPFDRKKFRELARKVRETYTREELIRLESTLGIAE